MNRGYKDWGDVYCHALRRGCDNGYAAWLADQWRKRKQRQEEHRKAAEDDSTNAEEEASGKGCLTRWRDTKLNTGRNGEREKV